MDKKLSVKKWVKNYIKGKYDKEDRNTQIKAGWFDWCCKETSLKNKTKKIGNIMKKVVNENLVNNCYIWFENCISIDGHLYDSFRFAYLKTGAALIYIFINNTKYDHKYVMYDFRNEFKEPIFKTNKTKILIEYLNNIKF